MSDFRRRLMMACGNMKPLYPDDYVDDGWIWAYYDVTDTENPTQLLYASFNYLSDFGANFIIDGETVARTKTYTFSTTGEHLVKMQRTGQIRGGAFRSLTALKRIYICDTVTSLADNCFLSSPNLTHIWLPDTITSIANQSFSYCTSLYRVNIDNTKITVAQGSNNYGLFRGSTSLKKVKLPTTVTAINGRCFQSCSSLNYVNIEELTSLTSIAILAFNATKLKGKIVFPSSLTSIANQAFQSCTELEEVDFGDTQLTTIPGSTNYGCFLSCSHLAKVTLPSTLTTLAQRAFYQCYALETIICKAVTPPAISSQSLPGTSYVQHIYVPAESVDTYKAASGWSSYASKIEAIATT